MLEGFRQTAIVKWLKKMGWLPVRLRATSLNGIPDLMALRKGRCQHCGKGEVEFTEVKRPGEEPSAIQLEVHRKLREMGFKVHVMTNPNEYEKPVKATNHRADLDDNLNPIL